MSQLEVTIKKKQKYTVVVDQGWYTKDEMINDLKWSMLCPKVVLVYRCPVHAIMNPCTT